MLFISQEGKVLDLACGVGKNMRDINKINPNLDVYGCDISQNLIDICIIDFQQNVSSSLPSIGILAIIIH